MKTSMHNAFLIYSNAEHDRRLLLLELTSALGGSRRSLISAFMSPSRCTQNVPPLSLQDRRDNYTIFCCVWPLTCDKSRSGLSRSEVSMSLMVVIGQWLNIPQGRCHQEAVRDTFPPY